MQIVRYGIYIYIYILPEFCTASHSIVVMDSFDTKEQCSYEKLLQQGNTVVYKILPSFGKMKGRK